MQKTLIVLIVGMLSVGCASTPTMKSVVGTYEESESGELKLVLHKDGAEVWEESGTVYDSNCKYVIKDGRIEVTGPRLGSQIFNIESNGNLMWIIEGGRKRANQSCSKKSNSLRMLS